MFDDLGAYLKPETSRVVVVHVEQLIQIDVNLVQFGLTTGVRSYVESFTKSVCVIIDVRKG